MKQIQKGFTLIELIVVIVILGILAATALPKFVDLSGDAATASAQGVAGALSSASSMNYAKYQISSAAAGVISIVTGTACSTVAGLLAGSLPTDVSVSGNVETACTPGATTSCTVTHAKGGSASATLVCTG